MMSDFKKLNKTVDTIHDGFEMGLDIAHGVGKERGDCGVKNETM